MTHSLTAHTEIDLHPLAGAGDLHALLIGSRGRPFVAEWAGLEKLRDELTRYLDQTEDDDPRPPESEYETLGRSGWDRPSRGT